MQTENKQGNSVGFFMINNLTLELYEDNISTCSGAINHLALDTDNINKAFKEIKSLGIKIESEEIQSEMYDIVAKLNLDMPQYHFAPIIVFGTSNSGQMCHN